MARIFRKADPFPDCRRVLLIGAPRSGTTLLATMIGRHNDVGIVNEDVTGRGVSAVLGKQVTGNKLCVPNQIRLNPQFFGRRLLKKLGLVREAPKSKFCIRDYLELPNLRIIAIIRDGGDSVSSMMVRGKNKLKKAMRRWAEAVETIYELDQEYGGRVLVVSFDDLVLQPQKTLEKVCRFLDIDFQGQMLDGHKHNPYYPEMQLNEAKAHPKNRNSDDLRLDRLLPTACAKYHDLLCEARKE